MRYLIILILFPLFSYSQITTGKFGAYNWMAYIPAGATAKMPTIIFFPGMGESTTNVNDLYKYGPLGKIRDGWRPTNAVFIALQPNNQRPGTWEWTANMLDSVFNNPFFKADPKRYSLTGLSHGAHTIYNYMKGAADNRYRPPASIVAMSGVISAECGDFYQNNDYLCGVDFRWATVPAWGICGSQDSFFGKQKRFWERMIQAGYPAKWTTLQGWGHSGWGQLYDINWRQDGKNVYEWMLQWTVGGVLPVKITDFYINDKGVYWAALAEQNIDRYEIEYSTDGLNFSKIGEVKATGKEKYFWSF